MGCVALQVHTISRINTIRSKFRTEIQSQAINFIQGDSGGKVYILRGDNIGHCEKRSLHTNMCLNVNCFRDRAL